MGNFTTITGTQDLQALSIINEIMNAYSERSQAIWGSSVADIVAGTDIQDHAFWETIQTWCETNCTSFVDHTATIIGETSVPMFTLTTWQDVAGIPNGFRRVEGDLWPTDWTDYGNSAFTYGRIQAGDILGPWLWVDLQNAFKALKWTLLSDSVGGAVAGNRQYKYVYTEGTKAQHEIDWQNASWSDTTERNVYGANSYYQTVPVEFYESGRLRAKSQINVPTFLNSSYDLYVVFIRTAPNWCDFDGLGAIEDKLFLFDSGAASNTSPRVMADYKTAAGVASPISLSDPAYYSQGIATRDSVTQDNEFWVFKWVFTYDS